MKERERDQALLSALTPEDRRKLERLVDDFVRSEIAAVTPEALREAADLFEDFGAERPPAEGVSGLLFAAALRERAAAMLG